MMMGETSSLTLSTLASSQVSSSSSTARGFSVHKSKDAQQTTAKIDSSLAQTKAMPLTNKSTAPSPAAATGTQKLGRTWLLFPPNRAVVSPCVYLLRMLLMITNLILNTYICVSSKLMQQQRQRTQYRHRHQTLHQ